jgi:quinol monooxygenase YgiN
MPPPSFIATAAAFGFGAIVGLVAARFSSAVPSHNGVFVLSVRLKLAAGKVPDFIELWRPLAQHCRAHEPGTLSYECAVSDKEPDVVVIYERYVNKAYLTEVHQKSGPFLGFKAALAESGFVLDKSGESFVESNVGYMSH